METQLRIRPVMTNMNETTLFVLKNNCQQFEKIIKDFSVAIFKHLPPFNLFQGVEIIFAQKSI